MIMTNLSFFSINGGTEWNIAPAPSKVIKGVAKRPRREVEFINFRRLLTPAQTMEPTVRIEKLEVRHHKYHSYKAWGIVICARGEETPIYFGSRAAALVCIATLLCQKAGSRLHRSAFKKPARRVGDEQLPWQDVAWLRKLYNELFIDADDSFAVWYGKMQRNSCHEINQAKAVCNRMIREALGSEECCIELDGEGNNRFYRIDLPVDNIEVAGALEGLVPVNGLGGLGSLVA